MGVSKIFPWRKRPRDGPKKHQQGTSEEKSAASGDPRKMPSVPDASKETGSQAPEEEPASRAPGAPPLTISQRVWNRAYDELAEEIETAPLVEAYLKVVSRATNPGDGSTEPDDELAGKLQAQMRSPDQRQAIMKSAVAAGQAKIAKSSKVTNGLGNVADFILKFKGVIDAAVQGNQSAALPWAGVCLGLQFLLNPALASQSNLNAIAYVTTRMDWYCSMTEHVLNKDNIEISTESYQAVLDELERRVVYLYKALLVYQMKSVCSYYANQGWVWVRNLISLDDWDGELQGVQKAEAMLESDIDRYNAQQTKALLVKLVTQGQEDQKELGDFHHTLRSYIADQANMRMDDQDKACLRDLVVVDPHSDMATIQGKNDVLLRKAYDWILRTKEYQAITDWSNGASPKVLWVNGAAGTGKTMLMIGIISEISDLPSNLAPGLSYFFCQALQENRNSPMDALRSLMWMLLIQQPHLIWRIREKHKVTGGGLFASDDQFWSLAHIFKEMLADPQLLPTYLLVDALDECRDRRPGVHELLNLISESIEITNENSSAKVKWILSSRPEVDVYNKLKSRHHPGTIVALDVQGSEEPVKAYVEHKLSEMGRDFGYSQEILDQMSIEIRERAQTTFLWVALVFKDLRNDNVAEYDAVDRVRQSPSSLSSMYDRIMRNIEQGSAKDISFCKNVLAAACSVYRPLTYAELHVLAGLPKGVRPELIVRKCGSFVTVKNGFVYLLHNSTKEYLEFSLKPNPREEKIGGIHANLARRSIDGMSEVLVRNIYKLGPSSEASDTPLSGKSDALVAVRYSCEFWVDHMCEDASPSDDHILDHAFAFLKEHFLHWIESLSLIHKLPTALASLRRLNQHIEGIEHASGEFVAFLNDAKRFVLRNISIIEKVPLQTYGAALAFSPNKSIIRTQYWNQRLPFIRNIEGIRDRWDPCLHTRVAVDSYGGVLFSPDGKSFASFMGLDRGVIQLWDPTTGFSTQSLTVDRKVSSIAFSPDSKLLASVSSPMVQVWDLSTGARTQTFFLLTKEARDRPWHDDSARSIVFSNDGKTMAIAFNETVQLRDVLTGHCRRSLRGHGGIVKSVAHSPDGRIIATASDDGTVKLWDYPGGACQRTLEECNNPRSVFFSPDGKKLACVNGHEIPYKPNGTLILWDMPSGTYSHTIGPDPDVQAAAFSPDSKAVAIASGVAGRIHLLDITTGAYIQSFIEGGDPIDVSASLSTGLVVSASSEGLIRVWDTSIVPEESHSDHSQAIRVLKLSPDGRFLATGSADKTVKLWDVADKTCALTLEGHTHGVDRIAFSPDSKMLASGAVDGAARIWDLSTGSYRQILDPSAPGPPAVAFSGDGAILATACDDVLKFWDPITGTCFRTVVDDRIPASVTGLVFSGDCHALLITTIFYGALVVDVVTGRITHSLRSGPWPAVDFPAISADKKICAFGSSNREVEIWDIVGMGSLQQVVPSNVYGHGLSFSDDGNWMKTSEGSYKVTSGVVDTLPDPERSWPALFRIDGWLARGDQKLLWLPPDYCGSSWGLSENLVALGQNAIALTNVTGQLVFLEFN